MTTTRREKSKANAAAKLNEAQRAAVARELRRIKTVYEEAKLALKLVTAAIEEEQLTTNEQLSDLEEAFDTIRDAAKDIALKTNKEKAELLLIKQLDDKDLPKFSVTGAGTVTKSRRKFWSMKDPEKFIDHVRATGDYEGFTTAVSSDYCAAYYAEHGKVPPGTDYWEKESLSFTKERPKKGA